MERILYRLENAFMAVVAIYLFLIYGTTWTGFFFFFVLPKLFCLIPTPWYEGKGYWNKIYDSLYALIQSYLTVFLLALIVFLVKNVLLWSILGWVIHIAIDRVIKYREKSFPHPMFPMGG